VKKESSVHVLTDEAEKREKVGITEQAVDQRRMGREIWESPRKLAPVGISRVEKRKKGRAERRCWPRWEEKFFLRKRG